jgi:hypothetical protein
MNHIHSRELATRVDVAARPGHNGRVVSPAPADARDHLERLRRGHAILRELRLRELRTLSVDEARLQYDQLVRAVQTQSHDRGPELERRAIEERVALRRRLTGRR